MLDVSPTKRSTEGTSELNIPKEKIRRVDISEQHLGTTNGNMTLEGHQHQTEGMEYP